ncbi:MAG: hypothetical protein KKH68_05435, partial [Proteobacteria bacterium]|nr:hypothetical protein [Pseudomonadota bacterium]
TNETNSFQQDECVNLQNISFIDAGSQNQPGTTKISSDNQIDFQTILEAGYAAASDDPFMAQPPEPVLPLLRTTLTSPSTIISGKDAAAAYQKRSPPVLQTAQMSDLEKYTDDQLLSNPGGDHYYLDEKKVVSHPQDQESFWGRIGKDVSDAFGNIKNFFQNLFSGSKIKYRDQNNQIQEAQQRGCLASIVDFFKDIGSALSFGAWRPDGETAPQGFINRASFFFSKVKEAVLGDLVQGVFGSVIHMGEDLLFAGWNLVETIPDATIGNFEAGKRLTTDIFDKGQVFLDYLTDILPGGDAWIRVHSADLKTLEPPVIHNINSPENNTQDSRWKYVRNTPFRKTLETVGSILMDIVTLNFLGKIELFSNERHNKIK